MLYPFIIDGLEGQDLAVEVPGLFGAPRLLVNGRPAPKGTNRQEFLVALPDGSSLPVRLELTKLGTMIAVVIEEVTLPLTKPLAWYEWAWNGIPFILVLGGGMVGGLIGGVAAIVNLRLFRSLSSPAARYALTAMISVAALISALAVVAGIQSLLDPGKPRGAATSTSPDAAPAGASPFASRPVSKPARSFVLPQDWKALQETCLAEFTGMDAHDRLGLQLGRITEPVTITVPAGLALQPVSPATKAGRCMTRQPDVLSAGATAGTKKFTLWVVNTDATRWEMPRPADRYEIAAIAAPPRLLDFMKLGQERKLDYHLIQTGVWVLTNDISLEGFGKNRLATNTYDLDRGAYRTTPLANYGGIRRVRLLFEEMQLAPAGFQLFKDQRAVFEKGLRRMDFDRPGVNVESSLVNGALETYAGEPETEALLQSVRNDPAVGKQAANVLKRYGR